MLRSATTASRNAENHAHRHHHSLQNTEEEPIASGTTPAVPAAQARYLSSSAAAILHGKTQGFVLRLPPQNIAHATFMQPLQCDLQPQLQATQRTTHTDTQPLIAEHRGGTDRVRNDPSRPRRTDEVPFIVGCSHFTRKNTEGFVLRFPPRNIAHATFMQPLHCDRQPQIQETHRTTYTDTTIHCKTQRRNRSRPERPQPHPPHRRGTLLSSAAATLHGKTQGFVLRFPPQNKAHATFMQPLQCDLQPQLQETQKTTHTDTTTHCRTQRRNRSRPERPQPYPPHRRGTFHRRLQPFYTEKRKVSCSGFLPKT